MFKHPLMVPVLFIVFSFSLIYSISGDIDMIYGGGCLLAVIVGLWKLGQIFKNKNQLRADQDIYQTIFENGRDGVILTDASANIWMINKQIESIFGYKKEELIGENVGILIPEDLRAQHINYVQSMTDDEIVNTVHLETARSVEGLTKDGILIPILISVSKSNKGFVAIINDISAQNNAIKYYQEHRIANLVSESAENVAFWEWDLNSYEVKWSNQMKRFLGLELTEDAKYETFMQFVHPQDRSILEKAIADTTTNQVPFDIEHRIVRTNGSIIWLSHKGVLINNIDNNGTKKLAGFTINITDKKELEEKLNAAIVSAQQAEKSKLNFLARISHDIRNPLNGIMGFVSIISQTADIDNQLKEHIENIEQNAKNLNKLVNDMVDLSRIELDNIHENPESINVRRLFKEVLQDLDKQIQRKKLLIDNQINRETEIQFNRDRLKQIFLNMMFSLIRVNGDNGKIRISDENNGKEYIIRFIDTNDELNKSDLERIFDPFNHLIGERKMLEIESIGLELAIVKATVEKMNGSIFIEQNPNFGNTIGMMFPTTHLSNYPIMKDEDFIELLYIEDSISSVKNMENIVNQFSNIRMTSSYSSDYGLSLLRVNHYDIIFVDINLPVFNGLQIYDIIRSIRHLDAAKIIAVSTTSNAETIQKYLNAGFNDFFSKPLDPALVKLKLVEISRTKK